MSETDGDTIDLISIDDGFVVLHLLQEEPWQDVELTLHWIRRRLNLYIGFVVSGQLGSDVRYAGKNVKFMLHCEFEPPELAVIAFAGMRAHLSKQAIGFEVTAGRSTTPILLPTGISAAT